YTYGDGAADATAIHPYDDAGDYTVTVAVTDGTYTSTSSTVVSVSAATMPDASFLSPAVVLSVKGKKGTLSGELTVTNQSKIPSPATEVVLTLNEPGSGTIIS